MRSTDTHGHTRFRWFAVIPSSWHYMARMHTDSKRIVKKEIDNFTASIRQRLSSIQQLQGDLIPYKPKISVCRIEAIKKKGAEFMNLLFTIRFRFEMDTTVSDRGLRYIVLMKVTIKQNLLSSR